MKKWSRVSHVKVQPGDVFNAVDRRTGRRHRWSPFTCTRTTPYDNYLVVHCRSGDCAFRLCEMEWLFEKVTC